MNFMLDAPPFVRVLAIRLRPAFLRAECDPFFYVFVLFHMGARQKKCVTRLHCELHPPAGKNKIGSDQIRSDQSISGGGK